MKITPLSKKKDFNLLFKKGKRIFKNHLTAIYFFLTDDACPGCLKIAYIVPKKISPKAVVRNKIKRQMRSATRQSLKESNIDSEELEKNTWIAILPSKKILDVSFQKIYVEIKQVLEKITRLQNYGKDCKNNK